MKAKLILCLTYLTLINAALHKQRLLSGTESSLNETCQKISYWLYNNNSYDYQLDINNIETINKALFLINTKTVFLLNGYDGNKTNFINKDIRTNYISKKFNVISVDYSSLVAKPNYLQAVANVNSIAKCFANFLKFILSFNKFSIENVHVVGFSLGAQIGGEAGNYLNQENITVPRLTGLDAAAPGFYASLSKINNESANFVDTIHTNSLLYGKMLPIGHVDFYVNETIIQSACIGTEGGNLVLCSHALSCIYFAESINTTQNVFCGRKVLGTNKEVMGEYVSWNARGMYTVTTNSKYPYAKDTTCE